MFAVLYTPSTSEAAVSSTAEWDVAQTGAESLAAARSFITDADQRTGTFVILDHTVLKAKIAGVIVRQTTIKDI